MLDRNYKTFYSINKTLEVLAVRDHAYYAPQGGAFQDADERSHLLV